MAIKRQLRKQSKRKQAKNQVSKVTLISLGMLLLTTIFVTTQVKSIQNIKSKAATITNCTVSASDLAIDTEEQNFLTQVNAYRATKGSAPVKFSPNLIRSASWMSRDMVTSGNLDHTDSLGRDPFTRMSNCGYSNPGTGENILDGDTTAAEAVKTWQGDVAHDTNLTDPSWKVIGIARSQASNGTWFWTMDAGATDDSGSGTVPTATPTSQVSPSATPTFVCAGSSNCIPTTTVTDIPSVTLPATATPTDAPATIIPSPSSVINPSEVTTPTNSIQPSATGAPGNGGNGNGGNNQGLISLLLGLIMMLLQLFAGFFGGHH